MDLDAISKELKKNVKAMILEERIEFLNQNIKRGIVKNGFEFVLKDLFTESDWEGVYEWPGNWRLGGSFARTIKNHPHIIREGKNKEGHALYKIDCSKLNL